MKLKPLIKKFSYNDIVATCKREGWKLPSSKDVEGKEVGYDEFWISDPVEEADRESHAHIYQTLFSHGKARANKHFLVHAVVVVEDKVCEWSLVADGWNNLETSCNHLFPFPVVSPIDHGFKFCIYCGCKIKMEALT